MKEKKEFDLIVVGGGTAGAIAAISAARENLNVAIIEPNYFLGGISTGSGLTEMNAAGFEGKEIYGGIVKEIFDELIENRAGEYHFRVPMSSDPNVKIDRLRYNPEVLKLILEKKALKEGITLFYGANMVEGTEDDTEFKVKINQGDKENVITSSYLIDATGECKVAKMLGYETKENDKLFIATLMFSMGNVDIDTLKELIENKGIRPILEKGYKKGILKGKILALTPIPNTNKVSVNVTRIKVNHEDPMSLSESYIEGRKQIREIIPFLKSEVLGMENSYLSEVSSIMGIRDARKLVGEYELTLDDLEQMKDFDDSIAIGGYPMDLHDPITNNVIWKTMPGLYKIPYRSIVPKNSKRMLSIGRGISATDNAFAAIRVMPIVMNVGESAGYAIAFANKNKSNVLEIDKNELRTYLREKGINI